MSKSADIHAYPGDESAGFCSRWSKRKLQARTNQPLASADINPSVDTLADEQASPEPCEEQVMLSDKDMPDLDSLNEDSDYSCFLSPGVSEKLRKLALRKLFGGQSFNLCDGLDDYDEEFTSFEKLGDIVTADMRYQLEQEARRKLQIAAENDDILDNSLEKATENTAVESMPEPQADETADLDTKKSRKNSMEDNKLRENENLS
jgi:hypothetical protein